MTSGDQQSAPAGEAVPNPLVVRARSGPRGVPGVAVSWTAEANQVSLSASQTTTDEDGYAQVSATFGDYVGEVRVGYVGPNGKGGTFVLTATAGGGSEEEAPFEVVITPQAVALETGDQTTLNASVTQADSTVSATPTWSSLDPEVATVNSSGRVTANGTGTGRIAAAFADGADTAIVTVSGSSAPPPPPPPPPGGFRAFPGAEGYGAMALTACSRSNMEVLRVTNLQNSGTGSFRAAVEGAQSDRLSVVVFDVAGVIELSSRIEVRSRCIYIAGQTAPGSGITIRAPGITAMMLRNDVADFAMRYVRMRGGYGGDRLGSVNVVVASGQNIIFDHMSFSWTTDKLFALSKYDATWSKPISKVTVQRSMLSEVLSYHPTAVQISAADRWNPQVQEIDMHHNLFAHNSHRNPNNITNGFKFVNNVVYNWNQAASQGSERSVADWIGNYYKRGPIGNAYDWEITYVCGDNAASYYAAGNIGPHNQDTGADNWNGESRMVACYYKTGDYVGQPLPSSHQRTTPLASPSQFPIQTQAATSAYSSVLGDVGANGRLACDGSWVGNADAVDVRIINDVQNGTGPNDYRDLATENSVGGYPAVVQGSVCQDSDGDGMPNEFEARYGLDPNDPSDATDLSGEYTFLEVYLNGS